MAELLILIMLWMITNVCSFIGGAVISKRLQYKPKAREQPQSPADGEQQERAAKAREEWRNMLTYDGNEQN